MSQTATLFRLLDQTHTHPHTHTHTHVYTRQNSSGRAISPSQRPLHTQRTQETNILALSEIRTPRSRHPVGHRNRPAAVCPQSCCLLLTLLVVLLYRFTNNCPSDTTVYFKSHNYTWLCQLNPSHLQPVPANQGATFDLYALSSHEDSFPRHVAPTFKHTFQETPVKSLATYVRQLACPTAQIQTLYGHISSDIGLCFVC
jgi:hypothetical protein